jgi:hypothetical protein
MLGLVALVRTDVLEERSAFIIMVTIGELGSTLEVLSFTLCIRCYLLLTLFLAHWFVSPWWWRLYVPLKRRFLQESYCVTFQKRAFFIVQKDLCTEWHIYSETSCGSNTYMNIAYCDGTHHVIAGAGIGQLLLWCLHESCRTCYWIIWVPVMKLTVLGIWGFLCHLCMECWRTSHLPFCTLDIKRTWSHSHE